MLSLASRLRPIWPLFAALVSAAMLAVAHLYFQRYLGLQPCALCLDQRNWHWIALGVGVAGFIATRFKVSLARWAALAVGLVFVASFVQGAHHVAVEQGWVIAQCDVSFENQDLTFDVNAPLEVPKCDQIAWQWLGISMAGYNALISLLLALASFAIAALPERKA